MIDFLSTKISVIVEEKVEYRHLKETKLTVLYDCKNEVNNLL